ncbi:MAG: hypothetical protein HQL64_01225 [Magnetococcales bacterium]|nr:hypothetical protein [Magnetococcales bacterium]
MFSIPWILFDEKGCHASVTAMHNATRRPGTTRCWREMIFFSGFVNRCKTNAEPNLKPPERLEAKEHRQMFLPPPPGGRKPGVGILELAPLDKIHSV